MKIYITGSRAATQYGQQVAMTLAEQAMEDDHVLLTTGAYGIEHAACQGALTVDCTINLRSIGLYPTATVPHLVKQEGVIWENIEGERSRQSIWGNQMHQANSADALVIVEAGLRGMAYGLGLVRLANHRPLFVVPGPVTSMVSQGAHHLIRSGATLITDFHDVIKEF